MLSRFRPKPSHTADDEMVNARASQAVRLVEAFEAETTGWFWETDTNGQISYLSAHLREALAKTGDDPLGAYLTTIFELDPDDHSSSRTLQFHLSVHSAFQNLAVRSEIRIPSGAWHMSGKPRYDQHRVFQGFTGSGSDLAERRRSQNAIARLAFTDTLTGLANRERMRSTLEQLLATRQSGFAPTALLLLDLDRFKAVNDTMGHQTGDELLKQVARRLQQVVGRMGVVGRLGGDEFQVILGHDLARAEAESAAETIIRALDAPFLINEMSIDIGCSIGIAIAPEQGLDVETLVRNADLALYAAKDAGRNTHRLYQEGLLTNATRRKRMEDDLRKALPSGQLRVVYQPVVSTKTANIVGYEALLRWDHPVHGPVSPADFIPIAEESGLIGPIGEWVLRTAIAHCAEWPADLRVAVNVSPAQFVNADLALVVANALAQTTLVPTRLEIEVTEGVFLAKSESTERTFRALKGLGVRLSLGYLQEAPFDKIKIDQSFVRGAIRTGNRNAAIIKAIVTLAIDLGMETTAEGVEQQDEIAFVHDLGCSHIQGFVYGQPCSNDVLVAYLNEHGVRATAVGHKISRERREKVLLRAQVMRGGVKVDAVIRNISGQGAMIEHALFTAADIGSYVTMELTEGRSWTGIIRWVEKGRAGVEFANEQEA
jgi:diguanylate cyclase (GGDEF)-like protein